MTGAAAPSLADVLAGTGRLEADQPRLRVDLMARIGHLVDRMTKVPNEMTIAMGSAAQPPVPPRGKS